MKITDPIFVVHLGHQKFLDEPPETARQIHRLLSLLVAHMKTEFIGA